LGAGILFIVVATLTGFYTWWMNYLSQPMRAVSIKRRGAIILLTAAIIAFAWRMMDPNILERIGVGSIIYFMVILSLTLLVTINGWSGASLTFPTEKE
jgi:hypothetical protein